MKRMKRSMLAYIKLILDKISFHPALFAKEYKKSMALLSQAEVNRLNRWIRIRGYMKLLEKH